MGCSDCGVPAAYAVDCFLRQVDAIERSSLVVSDEGLGRETGRGTEFIVLTR